MTKSKVPTLYISTWNCFFGYWIELTIFISKTCFPIVWKSWVARSFDYRSWSIYRPRRGCSADFWFDPRTNSIEFAFIRLFRSRTCRTSSLPLHISSSTQRSTCNFPRSLCICSCTCLSYSRTWGSGSRGNARIWTVGLSVTVWGTITFSTSRSLQAWMGAQKETTCGCVSCCWKGLTCLYLCLVVEVIRLYKIFI